jgi:hypothetical protein
VAWFRAKRTHRTTPRARGSSCTDQSRKYLQRRFVLAAQIGALCERLVSSFQGLETDQSRAA